MLLVVQLDGGLGLMGQRVRLAIRERTKKDARFAPFRNISRRKKKSGNFYMSVMARAA
jgi:hypothetical protein